MAVCAAIVLGALRARKRSKSAQVHVQPTQYLVADSIFDKVAAGSRAETISLKALSDYLVARGDVSIKDIQTIFNQLDTNGDGSVDRDEWRVGFTNGIIPESSS